jgi:hypothetical protein
VARRGDNCARDAASACVNSFLSVDYLNVDADQHKVLGCASSDFAAQYRAGLSQLRQSVLQRQVHDVPTILQTALVTTSTNQIQVLIAADVASDETGKPTVHKSPRIIVDAINVDGHWLISRLELVG